MQISVQKVNTTQLIVPPYHHQLHERWVTIVQASEYNYSRRPQGMQLHSQVIGPFSAHVV